MSFDFEFFFLVIKNILKYNYVQQRYNRVIMDQFLSISFKSFLKMTRLVNKFYISSLV